MSKKAKSGCSKKRIYLHIGLHRTGSTSFQAFLAENALTLRRLGFDVYRGEIEPNNHIELYLSAMRPERQSLAKLKYNLVVDQKFISATKSRLKKFLQNSVSQSIILSTEGLSLLRHKDELERLEEILACDVHEVIVILALRKKEDYLRSYANQLQKHSERHSSEDPTSPMYVKSDSWLGDFDTLVRLYEEQFGEEALRKLDYDEELRSRGNILPGLLGACDIALDDFAGVANYRLNRSRGQYWKKLGTLVRRLKGRAG